LFLSLCLDFSDFAVKLIDIESKEQKLFSGHEAPVLSVTLHPNEQIIVSNMLNYNTGWPKKYVPKFA